MILRKLPDGNQVPIEIDLYRACKYPHENIVVKAGDYLLLQYKCGEAVAAFVQRNLLEGALIGIAASDVHGRAAATSSPPAAKRKPPRISQPGARRLRRRLGGRADYGRCPTAEC